MFAQEWTDARWQVIIRGQTIDLLVREFERPFNTSALDTVRRKKGPNRKKGGGGIGGRQKTERETDNRGRKQEKFG